MATQRSEPEYARTLLDLLPAQGRWDDEAYRWLTARTVRPLALVDGRIDPLPRPTDEHQDMLQTPFPALLAYTDTHGGKVHCTPLRLRIRAGKFREPDLLLLRDVAAPRRSNRCWSGADLVAEVVSPEGAERDLTDKIFDYAEAGVPEYRIVEPAAGTITVLRLDRDRYRTHGVFGHGALATAAALPSLAVAVTTVLDAR